MNRDVKTPVSARQVEVGAKGCVPSISNSVRLRQYDVLAQMRKVMKMGKLEEDMRHLFNHCQCAIYRRALLTANS